MTRQKRPTWALCSSAQMERELEPTGESIWLELAKWITDVSDDTDEKQKIVFSMTVTVQKKLA